MYCSLKLDIFHFVQIFAVDRADLWIIRKLNDSNSSKFDKTFKFHPIIKKIQKPNSIHPTGGGSVILIKKCFSTVIDIETCILDSIVWLNIKQGILTKNKSVYIACIYIPPVKSKYYKLYDCDLYNELENSIELYSELGHVFILGDLNGRTGTLVDFLENDDIHFTLKNRICGAFEYSADSVLPKRVNPDLNTNSYGSKIISMCKSSGLRIVNGRHKNGFSNDFTYCGPIGMSVLDYFIVPSFYFPNINQLIVSNFTTYSDHAFLHLELNLLNTMRNPGKCSDAMEDTERRVKYKWKDEFKEQCTECIRINMDNIIRLQNRINFENQNSFDKSLSNFTCMIEDIMSPFFKTMPYVNNKPYKPVNYFDKPWFNTRCKELYRCYIDYLHVFNRSKSIVNHTNLTCAKREYKVMERRLKREYQRIEGNAMDFLKYSNPKLFYSKFRKRTEKKNNVPLQSFYEHFKKLSSVNIDNTCDEDLFNNTDGDCVYPELDEVITEEEILKAIRNLKRNKSHGGDADFGYKIQLDTSRNMTKLSASLLILLVAVIITESGPPRARTGVPKIAVVMTDGKSHEKDKTCDSAKDLRNSGVTIIVIPIGDKVDMDEIECIASGKSFIFPVSSFFWTGEKIVQGKSCKESV
ncbi:unnamed protein product [Mytilus edulis]|uniref:VWFA domain-containing protein n=1 Tax=Mytilus edulis TaxID=6550 RepID=A0A8S3TMH9_MYTED|nr:unnamed protein product [Mytilus edulis]